MTKEERAEAVRKAIADGCGSAAEIADRLGVTRNSVVGTCHRNGITLPGNRNAPRAARKTPKSYTPRLVAPAELLKPLRAGNCAWPACNGEIMRGSYCAEHASVVYQPPRSRSNRQAT